MGMETTYDFLATMMVSGGLERPVYVVDQDGNRYTGVSVTYHFDGPYEESWVGIEVTPEVV